MIELFHASDQFLDHAVPRDEARALVSGIAEARGQALVGREAIDGGRDRLAGAARTRTRSSRARRTRAARRHRSS